MTLKLLKLGLVGALLAGTHLTAVAAQDIKTVARENTFVIAGPSSGQTTFSSPEIANPYVPGADIRTGIKSMFEPLFYYNVFDDTVIPWTATGFDFNDDFTSLTLTLRDGVTWSDGEAFDADDVVFTAGMLLENAAGAGDLFSAKDFAIATASVEKVDDLTVRFDLNNPMPRYAKRFLMNYFGNGLFWLPEHIWASVKNPSEYKYYDPAQGLPVTTGPWTLALSSPNQIFMDRRNDWWGATTGFHDLPNMERVVGIPFVNTDRGAQLIVTNQVDMTQGFPTAALIQNIIRQNAKVTTFSGNANPFGSQDWWTSSLWFNHKSPNLPELAVRRAMDAAINREQLVNVAYSGASEATKTPFPAYGPMLGYIAEAEKLAAANDTGAFKPDSVAEIMGAAGYAKDGDGFWAKDGARLTYVIEVHPAMRAVGPVVVQLLKNTGFDVSFATSPESAKKLFTGKYDLGIFGHTGSIDSPLETLRIYHCDNAFDLDAGVRTRAIDRWCNEEFSALVDEFARFADGDPAAMEPFKASMNIWYSELVGIPLNQWIHRIPMNETYWTNYPTEDNPYIQPAFWYITGQGGMIFNNVKRVEN